MRTRKPDFKSAFDQLNKKEKESRKSFTFQDPNTPEKISNELFFCSVLLLLVNRHQGNCRNKLLWQTNIILWWSHVVISVLWINKTKWYQKHQASKKESISKSRVSEKKPTYKKVGYQIKKKRTRKKKTSCLKNNGSKMK